MSILDTSVQMVYNAKGPNQNCIKEGIELRIKIMVIYHIKVFKTLSIGMCINISHSAI